VVGIRLSSIDCIYKSLVREIVFVFWSEPDCRGNGINPEWFELDKSRGLESHALKVFMRFTVIISDYMLYVPALLAYTHFAMPAGRKIDKVLSWDVVHSRLLR
jgi:hypothetical protein